MQGYAQAITQSPTQAEPDPFDYQATVNALTVQFLSELDDTRVAALKWLIMLHQKAPRKVVPQSYSFAPYLNMLNRSLQWMTALSLLYSKYYLIPVMRSVS